MSVIYRQSKSPPSLSKGLKQGWMDLQRKVRMYDAETGTNEFTAGAQFVYGVTGDPTTWPSQKRYVYGIDGDVLVTMPYGVIWRWDQATEAWVDEGNIIPGDVFQTGTGAPGTGTPSTPPLYYDDAGEDLYLFDGISWIQVGGASAGDVLTVGSTDPGTGTPVSPPLYLNDVTGHVWAYDGSAWHDASAGLPDIAEDTILGRVSAGTGQPSGLTGTQVTTLLNPFTDALQGVAPASGGGTTNYLRADGTWAAPPGGGSLSDGDKGDITISGGLWSIDPNTVTNTKLRDSAALSVIGRSTDSVGDPADIVAAEDGKVLKREGLNIVFGDVATNGLEDQAVTYAKFQNIDTARVLGRVTGGTGSPETLTSTQLTTLIDLFTSGLKGAVPASGGGTANYLRADGTWSTPPGAGGVTDGDKGDITIAGGVWSIEDAAVSNAKIRDSVGLSVIGRFTNSTGDVADITAGSDFTVLRRSGTQIGFGEVATGGIANNAVTFAKIVDVAQNRVVGRVSAGAGDPEELTGTQVTTLLDVVTSGTKGLAPASGGGTANFLRADGSWAAPAGAGGVSDGDYGDVAISGGVWTIENDAVTFAKMQNITGPTFLGRQSGTGDTESMTAAQATALLDAFGVGTKGLAPASGGGTVNFLRADGAWGVPPIPGGLSSLSEARIVGRAVGAGAGNPQELTGSQATDMLRVFGAAQTGIVPLSGGGTENYLRADGSWSAPAGTYDEAVVTSQAELLAAFATYPKRIRVSGLVRIQDNRLGKIEWSQDPEAGDPFDIADSTTYSPLADPTVTLVIPYGSGFVFGKDDEDPGEEGCLYLQCIIEAGEYPIFFQIRSGQGNQSARSAWAAGGTTNAQVNARELTVVKLTNKSVIEFSPSTPSGLVDNVSQEVADSFRLYFSGDPFGGRLEAGGEYYANRVRWVQTFTAGSSTIKLRNNFLHNGLRVRLSATTYPSGFAASTDYYVVGRTQFAYSLSATLGGAAITPGTAGTSVSVILQDGFEITRDALGLVKVNSYATDTDWSGSETVWCALTVNSVSGRFCSMFREIPAVWFGPVGNFESNKTTVVEAIDDGLGGYELERQHLYDVSNHLSAIINSSQSTATTKNARSGQRNTGPIIKLGKIAYRLSRSINLDFKYATDLVGTNRDGSAFIANFGGPYAPALGKTLSDRHFKEWSQFARGMFSWGGLVFDVKMDRILWDTQDPVIGGTTNANVPRNFVAIYSQSAGSAENLKLSNFHFRGLPFGAVYCGGVQNIVRFENWNMNCGSNMAPMIDIASGAAGTKNMIIENLSTVGDASHAIKIRGDEKTLGVSSKISIRSIHSEGPCNIISIDSQVYENSSTNNSLSLSFKDLNHFSSRVVSTSLVKVKSVSDRSLINYQKTFTDASIATDGGTGVTYVNLTAHGFVSGDVVLLDSSGDLPFDYDSMDLWCWVKRRDANAFELHRSAELDAPVILAGVDGAAEHYIANVNRSVVDGQIITITGLAADGVADGQYVAWNPNRWGLTFCVQPADPRKSTDYTNTSVGPWSVRPLLTMPLERDVFDVGLQRLQYSGKTNATNLSPLIGTGMWAWCLKAPDFGSASKFFKITSHNTSTGYFTVSQTDGTTALTIVDPGSDDWRYIMNTRDFAPMAPSASTATGTLVPQVGVWQMYGVASVAAEQIMQGDTVSPNDYTHFISELTPLDPPSTGLQAGRNVGYLRWGSTVGFAVPHLAISPIPRNNSTGNARSIIQPSFVMLGTREIDNHNTSRYGN